MRLRSLTILATLATALSCIPVAAVAASPRMQKSPSPGEIYAQKTRITHDEFVHQLEARESKEKTALPTEGCWFASDGDDVHTSVYSGVNYASGHGWWINYDCPSGTRANVTIWLEEKLSGTWYVQGNAGYGANRLPGSSSTQRVTAKMACVNFSSHEWRSQVSADLVGRADTTPLATTPTWTLACY